MWHIMLLPLIVGLLVIVHVILVRRHGVVPPIDAEPPERAMPAAAELPADAAQIPTAGATTAESADVSR
jgi:quinol-cytochrome oxidoreductase complex cytochrome b subunit